MKSREDALYFFNGEFKQSNTKNCSKHDLLLFVSSWYSILLICDSVSKYASIKCLCDNSRHVVILLTLSAWMVCIYEYGPFFS